ncbi:calumenin-like isoform X1 [Tripterygium wilfordii]|uniref:calumenin-like isoform X1 n=1 Tax=Tripterygium wilfordii TaxID=458696 RepID=UPI0018F80636|nr:calumenin-like isoform X1 [Tripterygium wilfordii]
MEKLSVIAYITVALLLLMLISHSPKSSSRQLRHRRLKIRNSFNFTDPAHHDSVAFDPLVAEIERHREDKLWDRRHLEHAYPELVHDSAPGAESQPEWGEYMDAEDYLNDEDKFNVTQRLILLFPNIDFNPADGFVAEDELTEWHLKQSEKEILLSAQREMEIHDKDHDGFISFSEYEPPSWVHNPNADLGYDSGWWTEEHFNASDADGNGLLNLTEFNDFSHPADSKNPKLHNWLCKEEVRERDSDKDGKLNFKEFFNGLFDLVRNYDEDCHNASHVSDDLVEAPAKVLFKQLDRDGDGYLSDVELLPVIEKIHPSERYYAKQHAAYMISQADNDKDGRLTLAEMIENPYVFYAAIFKDDDDDFEYHDELR